MNPSGAVISSRQLSLATLMKITSCKLHSFTCSLHSAPIAVKFQTITIYFKKSFCNLVGAVYITHSPSVCILLRDWSHYRDLKPSPLLMKRVNPICITGNVVRTVKVLLVNKKAKFLTGNNADRDIVRTDHRT